MRILASTVNRQTRIAGIVGSMLVASVLTSGAVAAQDPADPTDPEQGVTIVTSDVPADGSQPVVITGSVGAEQGFAVGDPGMACGSVQIVSVGADGSQTVEQGAPDPMCSQGVVTIGGPGMGGPIFGDPSFGVSSGPVMLGDPWAMGGPQGGMSGVITVSAQPAATVTVTAVDGSVVSLKTDDGWTRDVDTTNVAITLDADTLAASDLAVGDKVQVIQVRNANDTYTITGLALVLPEAMGTVSGVTDSGFTITEPDGTVTPVVVTDATRWPASMPGMPGAATGVASLKDGDLAHVRGKVAEDGTLTATEVVALGSAAISMDPGMPVPAPQAPAPVEPAPTPEASPAA